MTWYILVHGMMEFKVEGRFLGSWRLFLQLFHGSRLVLRSSYEAPNDFNHLADLDAKDLHFVRSSPAQQCRELVGGHQQSCLWCHSFSVNASRRWSTSFASWRTRCNCGSTVSPWHQPQGSKSYVQILHWDVGNRRGAIWPNGEKGSLLWLG